MPSRSPHLGVLGSVNLDLVARIERFPRPGETLTGASLEQFPGGKGGNQALAARRLGAKVSLLACVGDDANADPALEHLQREGVLLGGVQRLDSEPTGLAMILVDSEGENQIVVAPGANAQLRKEQLQLPQCDGLLAQLEIPMDTLIHAATQHAGFFCLNAAPARPVADALLSHTDLLVVNELEAEAIGPKLQHFQGLVAVTRGASGAELLQQGRRLAASNAPTVQAIDTVGAGDAFTACLCVSLLSDLAPAAALERACIAGALATTRRGAQSAPSAAAIDAFQASSNT